MAWVLVVVYGGFFWLLGPLSMSNIFFLGTEVRPPQLIL